MLMAWYRNHYRCARCDYEWSDEWSCTCEDDCSACGTRHMTPYNSDDLTTAIETTDGGFVVLWSPETAEHNADYCELGRFATRAEAEAFVSSD
jgi:hypothetical protein